VGPGVLYKKSSRFVLIDLRSVRCIDTLGSFSVAGYLGALSVEQRCVLGFPPVRPRRASLFLFAVGIVLPSAAADAMATNTATNSVMCSEPSVPSSSEQSKSSTVAFRSCLRKSTDARTSSVMRITFADTVVFKSKNGKVRRLCPRKVDKSVKRSCVKPLVLRQDCNCNAIYCSTCSNCV